MKLSLIFTAALSAAASADAKPLKVLIDAGQSNMQGHVNVSTFDSMASDTKTASRKKIDKRSIQDAFEQDHVLAFRDILPTRASLNRCL